MNTPADTLSGDVRLLVFLHPGRTSIHYIAALARAAHRLGVLAATIDLGPVWASMNGPEGPLAQRQWTEQLAALCRRERITHALGYVHNGSLEWRTARCPASGAPRALLPSLGIHHLMLWTDHPNWATRGSALEPAPSRLLSDDYHTHFVKSPLAADELASLTGWKNVHHLDMAEDRDLIAPPSTIDPDCDAVLIASDISAPPAELTPLLDALDPDPEEIMALLVPRARAAWRALAEQAPSPASLSALFEALVHARLARPLLGWWRLTPALDAAHADSLAWLRGEPRRWYAAIAALAPLTSWRRSFWPAWLARRVSLGVFGSAAEPLGIASPTGGGWVPHDAQHAVYARGRCAITINAAHDEEALTHKAFQIAAAGVPCIHHASLGIDRCFDPGSEISLFSRGPELLELVRRAADDNLANHARRALDRLCSEHTWDHRLARMLALAATPARPAASADAPGAVQSAA